MHRKKPELAGRADHRLPSLVLVASVVAGAAAPSAALAQQDTASGVLRPSASISQTYTDNFEANRAGKSGDVINRVTAGLDYFSRSGLVQGFVNYGLSQVLYLKHDERNVLQNSLRARLVADVVDRHGSVELSSVVTQSARSAFGIQPTNDGRANDNTSEVATVRLAPQWQGVLGGAVAYNTSVAYSVTDAAGTSTGDVTTRAARFELGPALPGRLSWTVAALHDASSFKTGRSTSSDRLSLGSGWQIPDADLTLRGSVGREFGDLVARNAGGADTWSAGFSWVPSPRVSLDTTLGQRAFGSTYQVGLNYRTPQTVWRASASRDLSSTASLINATLGTAYDLFYAQFASVEPDPVRRAALVEGFLARNGIQPNAVVQGSFLAATQLVTERMELSAAWRGNRSTALLSWSHSQSHRADVLAQAIDDLGSASRVSMSDLTLLLSHRLTPTLNAGLDVSTRRGSGTLATQTSQVRTAALRLGAAAAGRAASWSVTARRSLNEAHGSPSYSESSITWTYSRQF